MRDMKIPAKAAPGLTLLEMKQFVQNLSKNSSIRKSLKLHSKASALTFWTTTSRQEQKLGRRRLRVMMEGAYKGWPDLRVKVEDILAEGDKVTLRNSWTATEAATGHRVEFHGFVLWRFANTKIVEPWATITPPVPVSIKASQTGTQ